MNAEVQYETDVAEEQEKTAKPFKKIWKFFFYVGIAVVGYASAVAIVVLIAASINS